MLNFLVLKTKVPSFAKYLRSKAKQSSPNNLLLNEFNFLTATAVFTGLPHFATLVREWRFFYPINTLSDNLNIILV